MLLLQEPNIAGNITVVLEQADGRILHKDTDLLPQLHCNWKTIRSLQAGNHEVRKGPRKSHAILESTFVTCLVHSCKKAGKGQALSARPRRSDAQIRKRGTSPGPYSSWKTVASMQVHNNIRSQSFSLRKEAQLCGETAQSCCTCFAMLCCCVACASFHKQGAVLQVV